MTAPAALSGAEPLFALRDVAQQRSGQRVLDGVTLDLPARELIALVGPSGAGKTSLLRLLNRLDDPTAGTVRFHGQPIAAFPVRELRCRIGFVFQTPVMFPGTVADNLRAAARLAGARRAPEGRQAAETWIAPLLGQVELDPSFAERDASRLSGGEKQRVALARALATHPEVLLLDEPTSALDPEVADRIMATVTRLTRERPLSTLMITHRLAEARAASTYVVMMERGRIVEAGPARALFTAAAQPRTRAYLASGA